MTTSSPGRSPPFPYSTCKLGCAAPSPTRDRSSAVAPRPCVGAREEEEEESDDDKEEEALPDSVGSSGLPDIGLSSGDGEPDGVAAALERSPRRPAVALNNKTKQFLRRSNT